MKHADMMHARLNLAVRLKQLSDHPGMPEGRPSQSVLLPDISIIIPTYNKASHLARLLPSILAQTFDAQRYEVIIVDDGSSDDTPAVVEAFRDQFACFLYVRQSNSGIGAARNTGLKHARGALISFLADDYVLAPEYLAKMSAQFKHPEVQGVRPFFDSLGRAAPEMAMLSVLMGGMKRQQRISQRLLYAAPHPYSWGGAAMTRREIFDKHGLFLEDYATCEDSEYAMRLDRCGIRIYVYSEVLFRIKNRTGFFDNCRRLHQYAVNGAMLREQFADVYPSVRVRRRPLPVRLVGLIANPVINTFLCSDSLFQAIRVAPLAVLMTLVAVTGGRQTRRRFRRQAGARAGGDAPVA